MHCDGKCHLKKGLAKLSEGSEKQDKNSIRNFSVESNLVFFQDFFSLKWNLSPKKNNQNSNFRYSNLYRHALSLAVFKPPVYLG